MPRSKRTRRSSTPANVQLSYTKLTSPIDGVVGAYGRSISANIIHPHGIRTELVVVTQVEPDLDDLHACPRRACRRFRSSSRRRMRRLTVAAYTQDNTMKLDEGTLGLVNNEIVQTTGLDPAQGQFP